MSHQETVNISDRISLGCFYSCWTDWDLHSPWNVHMRVHTVHEYTSTHTQRLTHRLIETPLSSSGERFLVSPSEWKAYSISSHLRLLGEKRALCQQSRDLPQPNGCHLSALSVCLPPGLLPKRNHLWTSLPLSELSLDRTVDTCWLRWHYISCTFPLKLQLIMK